MRGDEPDELHTPQPARPSTNGMKHRHRAAVDGDRDFLARFDAIEKRAGVVAQLTGGHLAHATIVA